MLLMDFWRLLEQQQLLIECALLLGHTLASERTGHNSVSDHPYHLYYRGLSD